MSIEQTNEYSQLVKVSDVIKAIQHKVCQGDGREDMRCQRGSCAYCGIMEIMNDIECLPIVDARIEQMCSSEPLYWETWAGNLLKCPACKYEYTDAVECTNFCGNCGTPLQF